MPERTVVIAGGGASGTLLSAELLARTNDVRVVVIEPRAAIGRGLAYSTSCPDHLLNVPASKMSAFADDPGHFVRWADERCAGESTANVFLPRALYGDYLESVAAQMRVSAGERFVHVRAECCDIDVGDAGVCVTCSDGTAVLADAFVLAVGNAAPAHWPKEPDGNRFFGSAWDEHALVPDDASEPILLLGTGLTAADAVLELRHNGHRGIIYMVSRRGLLPHEHRLFDTPPEANPEAEHISDLASALKHIVKKAEASSNWRSSVDAVRSRTNSLWQAMTLEEQRRFIRHAIPYWNVHRHRMAPEAAKTIATLLASGSLQMIAGRTSELIASPGGFAVTIRRRGEADSVRIDVGRVINCSGPEHDFSKLANPLIRNLMRKGLLASLPLGIGVDIAQNGALRDKTGQDSDRSFAIGPVRFGTLIETTAIPEIRGQAHELANLLVASISSEAGIGDPELLRDEV